MKKKLIGKKRSKLMVDFEGRIMIEIWGKKRLRYVRSIVSAPGCPILWKVRQDGKNTAQFCESDGETLPLGLMFVLCNSSAPLFMLPQLDLICSFFL